MLNSSSKKLTKKEKKFFLRELISTIDCVHGKFTYRDFLVNGKVSFISEYLSVETVSKSPK